MDASAVAQSLLLSLMVAALYSSVGVGLSLVWGVTRIVNFAHGEFVMLGGYITLFLYLGYGLSPLLGMVVAAVAMGLLGSIVYRTFLTRVLKVPGHNQLLATMGLSIILQSLAVIWWTPEARAMHVPDIFPSIRLGSVVLPGNNLLVGIVGISLYLLLVLLMKKTTYGLQMRLASDDQELAVYTGVNVDRMFELSFVIGCSLAGAAGALVALVLYVHPLVGFELAIKGFAMVALGGLGSIPGAFAGAVILALSEGATATFVSQGASWGYGVSFLLLALVLIIRPSGLFGKGAVES